MRLRHVLTVLACVTLATGARADDISDQIDKAATAWRAHDSRGALSALEAAVNLLHQARADALKAFLPMPPPGWSADAPETGAVAVEMLGGGTSATRRYRNGEQTVDVQITTDSPIIQGMAALIGGPLAMSAGIRTVTIGGRSVSYTESDNGFMTLVGEKIVVKVEGSKATPEPTLRGFIAAIDFDALEKTAH